MKWHGRFINTKEYRKSKHSKRTIYRWELSECGQWVIISTNDIDSAKVVMHQSEFARNVNLKLFRYTDKDMPRYVFK